MTKDSGIVPLRQGGVGTQMSPFGFIGLDDSPAQGQDFSPAVAPQEERQERAQRTIVRELAKTTERLTRESASGVTPATVIKSARARIKELRAFLKEAKKAEKELRELERLVAAAKKPVAPVREIRRSG